jgi:hypothetical protein
VHNMSVQRSIVVHTHLQTEGTYRARNGSPVPRLGAMVEILQLWGISPNLSFYEDRILTLCLAPADLVQMPSLVSITSSRVIDRTRNVVRGVY